MTPNLRLKLAGGDRSQGNRELSVVAHELSFHRALWASGPQRKRDPLGQHSNVPRTGGYVKVAVGFCLVIGAMSFSPRFK